MSCIYSVIHSFSSVQFSSFIHSIQLNSIRYNSLYTFIQSFIDSFPCVHFYSSISMRYLSFVHVHSCIHMYSSIHSDFSFLPSFFPSFMYSLCIIFASHRLHLHWHLNNHFKSLLMQLTNVRIGHWCILIALVQNFCPGTAGHFCYSNYEYDSFILMGRSDFSI
jgi:hypothetical protein